MVAAGQHHRIGEQRQNVGLPRTRSNARLGGYDNGMSILRLAARSLLASIFVAEGVDTLRDPKPRAAATHDLIEPVAGAVDFLPDDPEHVARITAAAQITGGIALATNTFRRPAALALAGTLVPMSAAHRFWETTDPEVRAQQRVHLLKNLALLGGLLIAAADTEGRPGAAWRARHAAEHASLLAEHARQTAALRTALARQRARAATAEKRAGVEATARQAVRDVRVVSRAARTAGRLVRRAVAAALPW